MGVCGRAGPTEGSRWVLWTHLPDSPLPTSPPLRCSYWRRLVTPRAQTITFPRAALHPGTRTSCPTPSPWHSPASAGGGPRARLVSESLGNRPQTGVTSVRVLVISGEPWPLFLILSPNRKPVSPDSPHPACPWSPAVHLLDGPNWARVVPEMTTRWRTLPTKGA